MPYSIGPAPALWVNRATDSGQGTAGGIMHAISEYHSVGGPVLPERRCGEGAGASAADALVAASPSEF